MAETSARVSVHQHGRATLEAMRIKRYSWWQHWRILADYILPRRYRWLVTANQMNRGTATNNNIIDSTGTIAARTLASGMMSGITSPTRTWFKLKAKGFEDDLVVGTWLTECEHRLMTVFQESNFYSAMAVMYFDLVVFGTACIIIYEDYDNVIHCFNPCLGEFFFELNNKFLVDTIGREMTMTHQQIVDEFGKENVTEDIKQSINNNSLSSGRTQEKIVCHLLEPNRDFFSVVPEKFKFREVYWLQGGEEGKLLRARGFHEWPGMTPRWDVTSNDPYGRSPGMDALGDIKQLQQETIRKAQAIDKMVNPPMIADIQLKNQPGSLLPGGTTYVSGLSQGRVGMMPVYTVMPPIGEMKQDIQDIQTRIKIIFQNDLFTGITDLQTVRTATEIDARREEKLVLLGPVLERILGEGLGKAIDRAWGIMTRGGLLPPPPQSLRGAPTHVEIDYVSMLALAQRGLATASIEKMFGFAGNLVGVFPEIKSKLDVFETMDEYAEALGVPPKLLVPTDDAKKAIQAQLDQANSERNAQMIGQGVQGLAETGKTLADTEVGGGQNALSLLLGGGGGGQVPA